MAGPQEIGSQIKGSCKYGCIWVAPRPNFGPPEGRFFRLGTRVRRRECNLQRKGPFFWAAKSGKTPQEEAPIITQEKCHQQCNG